VLIQRLPLVIGNPRLFLRHALHCLLLRA